MTKKIYLETLKSVLGRSILHYSGFLTTCMSAHFPVVKLGYADRMTHCGMVPNGVADSIEFQFTSLRGIGVLGHSFDTNFSYGLF